MDGHRTNRSWRARNPITTHCKCCNEIITGSNYRCRRCSSTKLQKSCFQPSNQIQHPFHRQHSLFLKISNFKVSCNACRKEKKTPTYNCSLCSFYLHFKCSSLTPMIKTNQEEGKVLLPNPTPHPFFLCSKNVEYLETLDPLIYVSRVQMQIIAAQNCAQCPMEIHHPFQPPHLLSLSLTSIDLTAIPSNLSCSFCWSMRFGCYYRCGDCGYILDTSCLMPIRDNTRGHEENLTILQSNHTHPLLVLQHKLHRRFKSCSLQP